MTAYLGSKMNKNDIGLIVVFVYGDNTLCIVLTYKEGIIDRCKPAIYLVNDYILSSQTIKVPFDLSLVNMVITFLSVIQCIIAKS